jgi:hypothetical protein
MFALSFSLALCSTAGRKGGKNPEEKTSSREPRRMRVETYIYIYI